MRLVRKQKNKIVNAWFGEQPTYILFNAPKDLEDWDDQDWLTYFKLLVQKYGKSTGSIVWRKDYDKVVNDINSNAQWLRYNCDVYRYLLDNGVDIGNAISKATCVASHAVDVTETALNKTTDAVGGFIGSTADTVSKFSQNTKAVVGFLTSPIVLLAGGGYAVYYFYGEKLGLKKNSKK